MPEPEEGKVTATGGGLRASGVLKLGGVRRSLLKKGLFVRFAIATTLKSSLPAPIFKQPSQHFLVHTWLTRSYSSRRGQLSTSLREASLRMRMSSKLFILGFFSR